LTARTRLLWAGVAAAAVAAVGAGRMGFLRARNPPLSLVLVSLDTLRADHLGCYGYGRPTSPALDALAADAVQFASVTAPAPWTLPSHASLLTGLYPHRHGVKNYGTRLDDETPTLASILSANGYRTGAIVNHHFLGPDFGLLRGVAEADYVSEWSDGDPDTRRLIDRADLITDRAIAWLARAEPPFFLFLHYFDLHSDYDARPEYRAMFAGDYAGPIDGSTEQLLAIRANDTRLDAADRDHLVALYDAEIRQLDDQLRRLFQALDARGLSRATLLVVTSDHGEEFMEHGSVLHGRTMYQEVISVPLLVRGPGVPRGTRVAENVSLVDVVPTILDVLGVSAPAGIDGRSVAAYWRQPGEPHPAYLAFAEADWTNAQPDIKRMVRHGSHKLHLDRTTDATELYDVGADPGEHDDLATRQADRVRELRVLLDAFGRDERPPVTVAPPTGDVLDRLRALGYVR
jgi:arylsulfatase A-like enzyme